MAGTKEALWGARAIAPLVGVLRDCAHARARSTLSVASAARAVCCIARDLRWEDLLFYDEPLQQAQAADISAAFLGALACSRGGGALAQITHLLAKCCGGQLVQAEREDDEGFTEQAKAVTLPCWIRLITPPCRNLSAACSVLSYFDTIVYAKDCTAHLCESGFVTAALSLVACAADGVQAAPVRVAWRADSRRAPDAQTVEQCAMLIRDAAGALSRMHCEGDPLLRPFLDCSWLAHPGARAGENAMRHEWWPYPGLLATELVDADEAAWLLAPPAALLFSPAFAAGVRRGSRSGALLRAAAAEPSALAMLTAPPPPAVLPAAAALAHLAAAQDGAPFRALLAAEGARRVRTLLDAVLQHAEADADPGSCAALAAALRAALAAASVGHTAPPDLQPQSGGLPASPSAASHTTRFLIARRVVSAPTANLCAASALLARILGAGAADGIADAEACARIALPPVCGVPAARHAALFALASAYAAAASGGEKRAALAALDDADALPLWHLAHFLEMEQLAADAATAVQAAARRDAAACLAAWCVSQHMQGAAAALATAAAVAALGRFADVAAPPDAHARLLRELRAAEAVPGALADEMTAVLRAGLLRADAPAA